MTLLYLIFRKEFVFLILFSTLLLKTEAQERLFVEIEIFSGMPNPIFPLQTTFTLNPPVSGGISGKDSSVFSLEKNAVKILAGACPKLNPKVSASKPAIPHNMGYRGICILRQTGQETYQPLLYICRKTIRLSKQNGRLLCGDSFEKLDEDAFYEDANSDLEKSLIRLAITKGAIQKRIFNKMAPHYVEWTKDIAEEGK